MVALGGGAVSYEHLIKWHCVVLGLETLVIRREMKRGYSSRRSVCPVGAVSITTLKNVFGGWVVESKISKSSFGNVSITFLENAGFGDVRQELRGRGVCPVGAVSITTLCLG